MIIKQRAWFYKKKKTKGFPPHQYVYKFQNKLRYIHTGLEINARPDESKRRRYVKTSTRK